MNFAGRLLLFTGLFVSSVAFAGDGSSKKGYWVADQSIEIAASPAQIFAYTSNLPNWDKWTAWNKEKDPTGQWTYSGTPGTVGHDMAWDGPELGKGRLVLTKVEGSNIGFDLYFGKSKKANKGEIILTGEGPTTVRWTTEGKLGLIGRMMKGKIETAVNKDFSDGLAKLKKLAEHDAAVAAWQAEVAAAEAAAADAKKVADEAAARAADAVKAAEAADKTAADALAKAKKPAEKKAAEALKSEAEGLKAKANLAQQEADARAKQAEIKAGAVNKVKGQEPK